MEHRSHELLEQFAVTIPSVRTGGRRAVGRPAPAGRRRAIAARRAEGRAARRADGRARRRADRAGARADQAAARARPRRGRDQPQPRRRVRGRGPHLRAAARPARTGIFDATRPTADEVVAAITGREAGGDTGDARRPPTGEAGREHGGSRRTPPDVERRGAPEPPRGPAPASCRATSRRCACSSALVVIWIIFQSQNDRFLTAINLTNLMLQITAVGLISVGVVYVLLLGEIDLSVGAVSGLAAAVMAVLNVKHGWNPYLAIAAGVLVGTAIGMFQGASSRASGSRRSWSRSPVCSPGRERCSTCSATPARSTSRTARSPGSPTRSTRTRSGWIMALVAIGVYAGVDAVGLAPARARRPHRHASSPGRSSGS